MGLGIGNSERLHGPHCRQRQRAVEMREQLPAACRLPTEWELRGIDGDEKQVLLTGEVLSRLSADTTLVQTVVGSSLSMGLRNAVMGLGALGVLVWTNPFVMLQVLAGLVLIVLPSVWFGRRVRKIGRAHV